MSDQQKEPKRGNRWLKAAIIGFVILALFTLLAMFFNRESKGVISQSNLPASQQAKMNETTNALSAKHFTLRYSSKLDSVSDQTPQNPTTLEVYRLASSNLTGRRILVVTIKNLPPGGLSEEPAYRLRQLDFASYRESSQTYGGLAYVLTEKLDGSELTAFTVSGRRLATIAYSLAVPGADLHQEAKAILESFAWQD